MGKAHLLWHEYRYFPYERAFALRELEVLAESTPIETPLGLEVELNGCPPEKLARLTYFREVILPDGRRIVPDQARLEASARLETSGGVARRQSTRYASHGLHEYRGKFNPQVVRAVTNALGIKPNDWLLDPCCGSGTTLVEARLMGVNAIGIDINPLAVLLARAKVTIMSVEVGTLIGATECLAGSLEVRARQLDFDEQWTEADRTHLAGADWHRHLKNRGYLGDWFTKDVLAQIVFVLAEIEHLSPRNLAPYFRALLSDCLRAVSLQDPGDLRIRRSKNPSRNHSLLPTLAARIRRQTELICAARAAGVSMGGAQRAYLLDNRTPLASRLRRRLPVGFEGFDAALTSPPYATALPYIDTQRLSLVLLGLAEASDIIDLERSLTGTRELRSSRERALNAAIAGDAHELPSTAVDLCRHMQGLLSTKDGFRRQRMPALVYGYFADIARMLANVQEVLRPHAPFALLVGRNQTTLGGEVIAIDTPSLIADVAKHMGWGSTRLTDLETYPRYSLHSRNSIRSETLVVLESPSVGSRSPYGRTLG
jgi:SAM-dependent methyltransferase